MSSGGTPRWDFEYERWLADYLKHLTTLGTGALLLLVTFADKFVQKPNATAFLVPAVVCFFTAVLTAFVAQTCFFWTAPDRGEVLTSDARRIRGVGAVCMILAPLGFIAGMVLLAAIAMWGR